MGDKNVDSKKLTMPTAYSGTRRQEEKVCWRKKLGAAEVSGRPFPLLPCPVARAAPSCREPRPWGSPGRPQCEAWGLPRAPQKKKKKSVLEKEAELVGSTPVLLPGKSHGWRSLVGCSPWGR